MQCPPRRRFEPLMSLLATSAIFVFACGGGSNTPSGSGGSSASGGRSASGGSGAGTGGAGTGTGGASTGTGGAGTGGARTGGAGAGTGGSGSGGAASGGAGTGTGGAGTASGGAGVGGAGTGGRGGGSATGGSAGGTSGGAGCSDSSLLFCEDFESAATGPAMSTAKWMTEVSTGTAAGTLTIDAMHARGQKALHVHTTGNGRGLIHVKNFAPPSNSFHGRMWMYIDAFPSAPNYAHYTLVEAIGTGNSTKVRPIGGQLIDGASLWGPGADAGPTGDWTNWQKSAPATAAKWVCIQWQMDASKNAINISIDGKANPDLSVDTKKHGGSSVDFVFPTFNDIWFGWWLYQSGPTPDHFDLWLDDLALGTSPIPCG